jgi:hypothetical protein
LLGGVVLQWNTFYKRYQNDPTKNYNYHDGVVPETCYKRQADVVLSLNAIGSLSTFVIQGTLVVI